MKRLANPFGRDALPEAPGLTAVLMRSLMANRHDFKRHLKAGDRLLVPPIPADIGPLDWYRHRDLIDHAYQWTRATLGLDGGAADRKPVSDTRPALI